jgi:mannosyltransferase OCH1-like enzyme
VILHQVWVGGPMPEQHRRWAADLQAMNPDAEYVLWGDRDLDWLQNRDLYDAAEELVPDHNVGQFRADLARFEILARFGGIYLDTDVQPVQPLDGLLGPAAWAGWEREGQWVGSSVLGGDAGAPFWTVVLGRLRESVATQREYLEKTGPRFLTRVHRDTEGLHVYPQRYFYPYDCQQLDGADGVYEGSYVAHHWNHLRTVKGKPL